MTHTETPDLSWLDDTTRRIAELDREFGCNVLDVGGAALTCALAAAGWTRETICRKLS